MQRIVSGFFAIILTACAAQLQVAGPYAGRLSKSDIQQITALITPSETTSHIYTRLEAVRPDEVLVKYGGYYRSQPRGLYTPNPVAEYFTVFKRHGKWVEGNQSGVEMTLTTY
jgi:hypothetical protein